MSQRANEDDEIHREVLLLTTQRHVPEYQSSGEPKAACLHLAEAGKPIMVCRHIGSNEKQSLFAQMLFLKFILQ